MRSKLQGRIRRGFGLFFGQVQPVRGGSFAWLIWGVASLFYFYEYFLRAAPSVMVPELRQHFHISGAGLGTLAALYFYIYAPMQIVVGIMLDRLGGGKIIPLALGVCALGSFLFSIGDLYVAALGRLLMGAGSSFAFVGAVYVTTNWFPEKKFALLTALTTALGMAGAAAGQAPVAAIVHAAGWQAIWIYCAIAGLFLMVLLWFVIPKRPGWATPESTQKIPIFAFPNLRRVVANPQTWLIGLYGGLINVPTSVFAVLWGVSFLNAAYAIPKTVAATAVSMIFIGWIIGGPIAGWWSDRVRRRRPLMLWGAVGTLVITLIVLYVPHLPLWLLFTLMGLLGLFSSGQVVCFAAAHEANPPEAKGNALAITNMLVTLQAAFLQPMVGWLLDVFAGAPRGPGHLVTFSAQDFRWALLTIPLCVFVAFLLSLFIRETYGSPRAS